MNKHLLKRTITVAIIFGVLFFLINYFSSNDASAGVLIFRSYLTLLALVVLYYFMYEIMNSPEQKNKLAITLTISLLIAIRSSAMYSAHKIGMIVRLIIGILAGYMWEFAEKNKNG